MQKFSRPELLAIVIVLALISIASFFNFRISLRRARDAQRMSDIGQIVTYLDNFHSNTGSFPASVDGKMVACLGPGTTIDPKTGMYINLAPCTWGGNSLLGKLPIDPSSNQGAAYLYLSDGRTYQLFASLEGKDEDEYKSTVLARDLSCGNRICNAGKAFSQTPLDKSIEEYENEIRGKL
jgi:hypothetical protein